MPDSRASKPRIPAPVLISLAAFVLSLLGAGGLVMGKFFAPKSVETTLAVVEEKQRHMDWKIDVLRVGQDNAGAQIQNLNINVAKLLERFKVEPMPQPVAAEPPAPPEPRKTE